MGVLMYRSHVFLISALAEGVVSFTPLPLYPREKEHPIPIG
jgi:hypothetical protein